jgi:molybdopterin-guanine dinucleotide biosynthesis protein B
MKIISLIGFSGSGKTTFITNAIRLFKEKLNYDVAVIKYIHEHRVDKEEKDSNKYNEAGAIYSIVRNIYGENVIFMKKKIELEQFVDWFVKGPFKIDLILTEGFRDLMFPTVLCLKNLEELQPQLNDNVKMISGVICLKGISKINNVSIPIVNIEKDFETFLKIFQIK